MRPSISRRSCDYCRTRKIACNRASPCSNCIIAKLECKYSPIASRVKAPREQRSSSKIDTIAEEVKQIRRLVEGQGFFTKQHLLDNYPPGTITPAATVWRESDQSHNTQALKQSSQVFDLIQKLTEDDELRESNKEANEVISQLQNVLKDSIHGAQSASPGYLGQQSSHGVEPPLQAIQAALRWVRTLIEPKSPAINGENSRLVWLANILPHRTFLEICKKVYFAIEDTSLIENILAVGYISHIFAEHAMSEGCEASGRYHRHCRSNFRDALARLPLLLPASIDAAAALTIGAYNATESSDIEAAWILITSASLQSQRLGVHTSSYNDISGKMEQAAPQRLFWTIYRLEKGLALRLGRPSTIRDTTIMLPPNPNEPTYIKVARLQGQVYDDLYSPAALNQPAQDRYHIALDLAARLQTANHETQMSILSSPQDSLDPVGPLASQCMLVCQASLRVWVLRALPTASVVPASECITAAREAINIHQQCMTTVRNCTADPDMVSRYINWAFLHVPFVPFSVIFTNAVHHFNLSDLALLEQFAASLQEIDGRSELAGRPHLLYYLFCKAARLYIESKTRTADASAVDAGLMLSGTIDFSDPAPLIDEEPYGLKDWYYENQQLMGILDSVIDPRYL